MAQLTTPFSLILTPLASRISCNTVSDFTHHPPRPPCLVSSLLPDLQRPQWPKAASLYVFCPCSFSWQSLPSLMDCTVYILTNPRSDLLPKLPTHRSQRKHSTVQTSFLIFAPQSVSSPSVHSVSSNSAPSERAELKLWSKLLSHPWLLFPISTPNLSINPTVSVLKKHPDPDHFFHHFYC